MVEDEDAARRGARREGFLKEHSIDRAGRPTASCASGCKLRCQNRPVITGLKRVSRPSLRVYVGARRDPGDPRRVSGVNILSTPAGILTDREARKRNVGGEILCCRVVERERMSRIGKLPIAIPAARQGAASPTASCAGRGSEGQARAPAAAARSPSRCTTATVQRARDRTTARSPLAARADATADRQHGARRARGLHAHARDHRRRLPRRGARHRRCS